MLSNEEVKKSYSDMKNKIQKYYDKNNYMKEEKQNKIVEQNIKKMNENKIFDEILGKEILSMICSNEKIEKEILTYELLNNTYDEKIELEDEAVNKLVSILKKYQNIVGGFCLEDDQWTISDENNRRFKIKGNEKILYNSIQKKHFDKETIWFIENILEYMNRNINKEKLIIKYFSFEDEKNSMCWVIYKVSKK